MIEWLLIVWMSGYVASPFQHAPISFEDENECLTAGNTIEANNKSRHKIAWSCIKRTTSK